MKRNERGVTLIALVVTIVVLLILAGTAIAMLSGDDGIMTNAQRAQAANTEGEVREKFQLAYSALRTEIDVNSAVDSAYDAQDDIEDLFEIAVKEMGLELQSVEDPDDGSEYIATDNTGSGGYTVVLNVPDSGNPRIYFEYRDNKFGGATAPVYDTATGDGNVINRTAASTATQKVNDLQLKQITAQITVEQDGANFDIDAKQVLAVN